MLEQMMLSRFPSLKFEYMHSDYAVIGEENFPVIAVFPEQLQPTATPQRVGSWSGGDISRQSITGSKPFVESSLLLTPARFSPSPSPSPSLSTPSSSHLLFPLDAEIGVSEEAGILITENETNTVSLAVLRCVNRFGLVLITVIVALAVPCFSLVLKLLI